MNKLFCISVAALVFASCENSGNRKLVDPVQSTPTTVTNTPVQAPDTNKPVVVSNPVTTVNPVTPPTTTTTTNTKSSVALNPDHGAPGHRCDIPVGAPLNSPANTTQLPTTTPANSNPAPVVTTPMLPQPQPATNKNAKLNPAHGEPGHDCAVPVGQPLKS